MHELPWRTGLSFQPWTYGAGHSQLRMFARTGPEFAGVMLLFEGTKLIKLAQSSGSSRVLDDGRLIMSTYYKKHLAGLPAPVRQPPRELDGAEVVQFALVGPAQRRRGNSPATAFAVTGSGQSTRLLQCDDDWNVLASSTHAGVFKAMRQAATEFEALEFLDVTR
ncbi:hypothetical protein UK23_18090 [Lentzea aerocolonigenes]|uniref:Uncharacterized protein n=1 Tax=Lentzea aerocolonigenes TaxID=68170 RepID=A0A0F0GXA7_LENAE|nr:hypothetical protein [Lentzea aerocolonigenes]KJK48094.1 hypothetical protein UK23_18090 [Lentzea aerocolonigenes]